MLQKKAWPTHFQNRSAAPVRYYMHISLLNWQKSYNNFSDNYWRIWMLKFFFISLTLNEYEWQNFDEIELRIWTQ